MGHITFIDALSDTGLATSALVLLLAWWVKKAQRELSASKARAATGRALSMTPAAAVLPKLEAVEQMEKSGFTIVTANPVFSVKTLTSKDLTRGTIPSAKASVPNTAEAIKAAIAARSFQTAVR